MVRKILVWMLLLACWTAACVPAAGDNRAANPDTPQPTSVPTKTPTTTPTSTPTLSPRQAAESFYSSGLADQEEKAYELAIAAFSEAIRIDPEYGAAYVNRGLCLYRIHKLEQAISDFEQALELGYEPESAQMYVNRGRSFTILDDYEAALADFDQALQLDPQFAEAYSRRGYVYTSLGDYDSVLDDLNLAIEMAPDNPRAFVRRGYLFSMLEEYDQALVDFDRAIALDPALVWAYQERGIVHTELGNLEEAEADLTRAIELDPEYPDVYFSRGIYYAKSGRYEEGIADLERVIELDPEDTYAYFILGLMHDDASHPEKAITNLEKAVELGLDPEDEEYALSVIEAIEQTSGGVVEYIGETSQGLLFALGVEDSHVTMIEVRYDIPGCDEFNSNLFYGEVPIENDQFTHESGSMDVEGTFEGATYASGTLKVSDPFCGGEIEATWTASTENVRPVEEVEMPPVPFPEMTVPVGLFFPDQGADNVGEMVGVADTQGDWISILTFPAYSLIPIPAGWTASAGDSTIIEFSPDGNLDDPPIFIVMSGLGYAEDIGNSAAVIAEIESSVSEMPTAVVFEKQIIDIRHGFLFLNLEMDNGKERHLLILVSEDSEGLVHRMLVYVYPENWETYYPIVQAMIENWVDPELSPLGMPLPEALAPITP